MPSLTYTPGSRPPTTYSAAGAAKYIHAPTAIRQAGIAPLQRSGGAARPRRKLPREASASAVAMTILPHTSRLKEYPSIAARANATVIVTMTLSMTPQNRRSSAGSAARFERSASGSRKITAPGRYAMAIRDAMVISIVGKRPRSPPLPAPSCARDTRARAPVVPMSIAAERSRSSDSIAAASAGTSRSGTRRAVVPSVATAPMPPAVVATSGVPDAMISITVFGRPSTFPASS